MFAAVYQTFMMQAGYDTRIFKGNQLACATGIGAWSFITIIPSVVLFLWVRSLADLARAGVILVPLAAMLLLFFMLLSFSLFYFAMDSTHLHLHNHNLPFIKRTYLLQDIAKVVLEHNRAELLLTNGRKKIYRAESLKDEDWLALKQQLQQHGIAVHDRVDYEEQTSPQGKADRRRMNRGLTLLLVVIIAVIAFLTQRQVERWVLALSAMLVTLIGIVVVFLWYTMGGNNSDTDNGTES